MVADVFSGMPLRGLPPYPLVHLPKMRFTRTLRKRKQEGQHASR